MIYRNILLQVVGGVQQTYQKCAAVEQLQLNVMHNHRVIWLLWIMANLQLDRHMIKVCICLVVVYFIIVMMILSLQTSFLMEPFLNSFLFPHLLFKRLFIQLLIHKNALMAINDIYCHLDYLEN